MDLPREDCCVLSHSVVSDSVRPHGLQPARLLCPWGLSRQECWSGLPCPPPGDLPDPGVEPRSPALQADSLLSEPPGKSIHGEMHGNEESVHQSQARGCARGRLPITFFLPFWEGCKQLLFHTSQIRLG